MNATGADANFVSEVSRGCLLTRTRQISRVLTNLYDHQLRQYGVNSPQFTLLVVIARLGPVSRAEIGRQNHQERSTLTRNLRLLLSEGWVEEVRDARSGRSRPLSLTLEGRKLLGAASPAWRVAQRSAREILGADGADAILAIANDLPQAGD